MPKSCSRNEVEVQGKCYKRRAWMDSLESVADNPLYIFDQMQGLQTELLRKDSPDISYMNEKVKKIQDWIDEISEFHGSISSEPFPSEPNINYQPKNKGEARELAIGWQNWQSEQSLSYGELSDWQGYFGGIAKKFRLQKEFKEEGII